MRTVAQQRTTVSYSSQSTINQSSCCLSVMYNSTHSIVTSSSTLLHLQSTTKLLPITAVFNRKHAHITRHHSFSQKITWILHDISLNSTAQCGKSLLIPQQIVNWKKTNSVRPVQNINILLFVGITSRHMRLLREQTELVNNQLLTDDWWMKHNWWSTD